MLLFYVVAKTQKQQQKDFYLTNILPQKYLLKMEIWFHSVKYLSMLDVAVVCITIAVCFSRI